MATSESPQKPVTEPAYGRRAFLRQSLVSVGSTVQEFIKHRDAKDVKESRPASSLVQKGWIRPPGAVGGQEFLDRCTKCGDCIDSCPHHSIQKLQIDESPAIFPGKAPCQLCHDFPCIEACDAEALMPVSKLEMLDMGVAVISAILCTASNGCNACVSKCPMQAISMDFFNYSVSVDGGSCVGCGLCQFICGTVNDQSAIRVLPKTQ